MSLTKTFTSAKKRSAKSAVKNSACTGVTIVYKTVASCSSFPRCCPEFVTQDLRTSILIIGSHSRNHSTMFFRIDGGRAKIMENVLSYSF